MVLYAVCRFYFFSTPVCTSELYNFLSLFLSLSLVLIVFFFTTTAFTGVSIKYFLSAVCSYLGEIVSVCVWFDNYETSQFHNCYEQLGKEHEGKYFFRLMVENAYIEKNEIAPQAPCYDMRYAVFQYALRMHITYILTHTQIGDGNERANM